MNTGNDLEEYRIEQLEKAMEEHEKECKLYREKMETRLDKIETNQSTLTLIAKQTKEAVEKLVDKVSENEKRVNKNELGVALTKKQLAVIGSCIVVGMGILGFVIRYGDKLVGG